MACECAERFQGTQRDSKKCEGIQRDSQEYKDMQTEHEVAQNGMRMYKDISRKTTIFQGM